MRLGVVCGLAAEARLIRRRFTEVAVSGADATRAVTLSAALLEAGCDGLLSIGIAGGLAPGLAPGTRLVPGAVIDGGTSLSCDAALIALLGGGTGGRLVGMNAPIASAADKAALHHRSGAMAVDTESHAVARVAAGSGRPFAVLRVVADAAGDELPPAALIALTPDGRPRLAAVARAVLSSPGQIPALIGLAGRTRTALAALEQALRGV